LISKLVPEIMRLRAEPSTPICLYIDSLGGSVAYAQKLLSMIKAKTQEEESPWVITVAVGFAGSAAADLLSLGDYALAYPNSLIHYHGTSHYSERITLEDIPSVETNLRETNESYALRLASRMFNRLVLQDVSDHGRRVERRIVS
jgi:ATP-dependent protease ClpP protease subunit